ncbi:MAG: glycosyltransferase family 1 protein [Calditrichaeota bacterium]|nr:MAG: glycosyltransferase family 1 protein [Calditrichota bacterium]
MRNLNQQKFDMLYFSGDWGPQYHRRALVLELSKLKEVNRLFIIEPFGDFFHSLTRKPFRLKKAFSSFLKVNQIQSNLFTYTPLVFMHFLVAIRLPGLRQLNRLFFQLSMNRFKRMVNLLPNPYLWVTRPEFIDYIDFVSPRRVIYDCYDEWQIDIHGRYSGKMAKWEEELIRQSYCVFTTASTLQKKCLKINPSSYFIPNAADVELFTRAYTEKLAPPEDLAGIPKPIIGYIGLFRNWLDFDLLRYLFENQAQHSFVFIGNWASNVTEVVEEFKKYQNVYFLGAKTYGELPYYLQHFDIAIIPNKINRFNQNVIPYKLFEYMAAGKKIVCTNTSHDILELFSEVVAVASSKEEFHQKILDLLATENFDYERVYRTGREQSWKNRVLEMRKHLFYNEQIER